LLCNCTAPFAHQHVLLHFQCIADGHD
jgi:hypothetical protein